MTSFTHNLPWIISEPITAVIGKKCYQSLIEDLNFGDVDCIKLSVSKGLGIGIVLGGSIVKVPQILLILNSRSARGLSLPAYILETLGYAISLAYSARNGFPFSTYGENFFLTIQNFVVTLLIVFYGRSSGSKPLTSGGNSGQAILAAIISAAVAVGLLVVPSSIVALLQVATLPISLFSKVPQILQNSRAGSTGNLSTVAVVSQVVGCLARLFTTATEVGDPIVFWGFGLALILNLVIAAQMWAYWGKDELSEKIQSSAEPVWAREKIEEVESPARASPSPAPGGRKWARKLD